MGEPNSRCVGPRRPADACTGRRGLAVALCLACLATALALCVSSAAPALASQPCPNEALRAQSNVNPATGKPYSSELPDCRAYELVSSEQNDSSPWIFTGGSNRALVSGNGDSLVWDDPAGWPGSRPSNGLNDVRRAERGAAGRSPPQTLAPENVDGAGQFALVAASSDLSTVLLEGQALSGKGPASLLESGPGGCCMTIASGIKTDAGELRARLSNDGSHVFLQTEAQLLPEDKHEPGTNQVYESTQPGGLRLAGVDSEGAATSPCGAVLAGTSQRLSSHDVSANGSRLFFESPDPGFTKAEPECRLGPAGLYVSDLYVRENGATTIDISTPPPGVSDYGARFVGASEDGARVFFVSRSALTRDVATNGSDNNLYEYNVGTGALTHLSVGVSVYPVGSAASVSADGAIVSADGSHVYFTAPASGGCREQIEPSCTMNLYMYTDSRVSFIATIGPAGAFGVGNQYVESHVEAPLGSSFAAVTLDGADLIFDSERSLTAYNSEGRPELYRYDAASSTISCVSCSATGGPAEGIVEFHAARPYLTGAETASAATEQIGGLSSDGSTVFFAATGQRLPAAVNAAEPERASIEPVLNVYEWRDGVLSLISSGTSAASDRLIGASPSGSDVFFTSSSEFVGQDGNHAQDIFDARVEGGLPAPSTAEPCVSLAACRSMPAIAPVTVAPATVSVSGPGNVTTVAEESQPSKAKTLTRAQELAKALKSCKKVKKKTKRVACEKTARQKYALPHKAKHSSVTRNAK